MRLLEELCDLAVLMEADPVRDEAFRAEALKFLEKLRNKLRDPGVIEDLKDMKNKETGGLAMPGEWVDSSYKDLLLIFTPAKKAMAAPGRTVGGGFGYFGKQRWKVILLPSLMGPFDPTYLATRIDTGIFVHEFTHYMDNKRGGGFLLKDKESSARQLERGEEHYYNDPGEFNAYYQEAARGIETIARTTLDLRRSPPARKRVIEVMLGGMKDVDSFVQAVTTRHIEPHFVAALNPTYRKKLLSRLAGLFSYLKKKYEL